MAMSVVYTTFNGQIVLENRGGVASFYAPDTMGSTVALLNSAGVVTDTYSYWPYGEVQNHSGSSQSPFGFLGTIGYYTDVVGSFLYVRARFLRQALARWQTLDLLWPFERAYAYVGSSPLTYVDPTGLIPRLPVGSDCAGWAKYLPGMLKRCEALPNNSVCISQWNNLACAYAAQCLHKPCSIRIGGGGGGGRGPSGTGTTPASSGRGCGKSCDSPPLPVDNSCSQMCAAIQQGQDTTTISTLCVFCYSNWGLPPYVADPTAPSGIFPPSTQDCINRCVLIGTGIRTGSPIPASSLPCSC